jgi:hypothetical protein
MKSPFDIINKYNLNKPTSLIQIGASGGQELEEFVANNITDALLIEPLEMPFSILKERVQKLNNYIPFRALIHSTNGIVVDFHVANNAGMSSSILAPNKHLSTYPNVSFSEKIKLTGYRLDSLVSLLVSQKIIGFNCPDMLYLDVQGAELIVLRSAGELLEKTKYIWTEVGVGDGYTGGASYVELISYLNNHNFQLIHLNCEPGAFGDAFFMKNDLNL